MNQSYLPVSKATTAAEEKPTDDNRIDGFVQPVIDGLTCDAVTTKSAFDKIMEAVNGDELEGREGVNPFDFWTGCDFKLRAKKVAGYPNYDSSEFHPSGTLEDLDDAQLESIWKREHSLQGLVAPDQFKSYDELKARLDRVLGRSTGGSETAAPAPRREVEEVVSAKPQFKTEAAPAAAAPEPVAKVESESDDEDVMDYFKRLAEE